MENVISPLPVAEKCVQWKYPPGAVRTRGKRDNFRHLLVIADGRNFDPYYKWLAIPPRDQPPNHYRLLAIDLFESDADVIEAAADQRMSYLQQVAAGEHVEASQQLLNELSAARRCLVVPDKRAEYDIQLRADLQCRPFAPVQTPPEFPRRWPK